MSGPSYTWLGTEKLGAFLAAQPKYPRASQPARWILQLTPFTDRETEAQEPKERIFSRFSQQVSAVLESDPGLLMPSSALFH